MRVVSAIFLFFLVFPVRAEPTPARVQGSELTLQEAVARALVTSPQVSEIDSQLAGRIADAISARVKENPVVDFSADLPIERPPGGGIEQEDVLVTLSQTLRWSDFGARTKLAKAVQEAGAAERVVALNEYIQRVAILFVKLWQLRMRAEVLDDARSRSKSMLSKVSDAAQGGLVSQGDIELLRAEVKNLEAEALAARVEGARTRGEFTRLTGYAVDGVVPAEPQFAARPSREGLLERARQSALPVQLRYRLLKQMAEYQLEVARLDSTPALSPRIGFGRHDDGTSQVTVGISIPIPVFHSNDAEKARAQGALSAALRAEEYGSSESLIAELSGLADALDGVEEQLKLYEGGVIPAKSKALEAYSTQLAAGVGTLFQIWQAQRDLNESRLRTLDLKAMRATLTAQVTTLLGEPVM